MACLWGARVPVVTGDDLGGSGTVEAVQVCRMPHPRCGSRGQEPHPGGDGGGLAGQGKGR